MSEPPKNTNVAGKNKSWLNQPLANMYDRMLRIRMTEDVLQQLCNKGLMGDLHFSKGQEAISVGVNHILHQTDLIVSHHRTIARAIERDIRLPQIFAELQGKTTGINHGSSGEMQIHFFEHHFIFSFQQVGTCMPVAAGIAYAQKYIHETNNIVALFIGDAATSNGQFHEGINIASIKKVPLMIIIEDNHIAGNVPPSYYLPTPSWGRLFNHYEIPTYMVNGNHIDEIIEVASKVAQEVRSEKSPIALVCDTDRNCWHKQGQRDIRPPEVLSKIAERDPLTYCLQNCNLSESQINVLKTEIQLDIDEALNFININPETLEPT